MPRILIATFLALLIAAGVFAQDAEVPEETAVETATGSAGETAETDVPEAEAETAEEDEVDDSDLDEQGYEEDDDDFVPTEEIPADEPIPFPTNI